MRPISPNVGLPEESLAEDQLEYLPMATVPYVLPQDAGELAGAEGRLSRWTFTPEERQAIAQGEDLYIGLLTFGRPPQPISPTVGRPGWLP